MLGSAFGEWQDGNASKGEAYSVSTSDENTALNFPHKFAPLPLSRPSYGTFHRSAPSDAPSNCQDSADTPTGRSTIRSAPRSLVSALQACAALPNELLLRANDFAGGGYGKGSQVAPREPISNRPEGLGAKVSSDEESMN